MDAIPHVDVLLVTVTETEAQAVFEAFTPGQEKQRRFVGDNTYYDLGGHGSARVLMVQSEMGSGGLAGTQATVQASIQALHPDSVVMVGIAFGVDAKKQKIGDLLVSRQLMSYEPQRVGTDKKGKQTRIPRGDRAHASVRLVDRFVSGKKDWNGQEVHVGLVLSGEKLVDNLEFRQQLLRFEPEAIGGEMEGAGLYAAAQRAEVDWILVKAICDWAAHKSRSRKQRQQLAAQNAAQFVLHVIRQGGLAAEKYTPAELAPTAIPGARPSVPLQRPRRAEHFTGREREVEQLVADVQPGRVATLCGPGGIGKTALAAEAIWRLAPGKDAPERFPDGIVFHTFYHQAQAALAQEAMARAYGEEPRPSPAEAAQRALAGRRALVVLDGAENADDLEAVLAVCGSCAVLVTSRRHQDAVGDWRDVRPLPTPEAVELLRAWGGSCAGEEVVAQRICELMGGLPLAVRLAGRYMAQCRQGATEYLAWLEKTPLTALDLGRRQRESVPLLLERSLEQVGEMARRVLAAVGLLDQTPFSAELIAVALDAPAAEADRGLGELVTYGLLLRSEKRYQVSHALVHTYSRQRLPATAGVVDHLATYYNAFTHEQSALGVAGYAKLDGERAHILAVQAACAAREQWEPVRSLTWAIEDYLDLQGHSTERVTIIKSGLAAARASGQRRDEGAFLNLLGLAYDALGDARRAIEFYEQALTIDREICAASQSEAERTAARRGEGAALGNLGIAYAELGDARRAIEFFEQALVIDREIGNRRGESKDLGNLGNAYHALGDAGKAIQYHEQALVIAREIGDRQWEGGTLSNLGVAYDALGDARRAIEFFEQALVIDREIGNRRAEGGILGNLGVAYKNLGDARRAIEFNEQQLVITREIGDRRGEGNALVNLGSAYFTLGEYQHAAEYYNRQHAIAQEIGDRRGEGNALWGLAICSESAKEMPQAFAFGEAALKLFEAIESPSAQTMRDLLAKWRGGSGEVGGG